MAFAASLHPLSLADAFRASALRTPGRVALAAGGELLSYADLLRPQPGRKYASPTAVWLAGVMAQPPDGEDRPAAVLQDGVMSHREIALRALDNIVEHAAYDRDATLACTLPAETRNALVAATVALWLGATLHQAPPGEIGPLLDGIAAGRFQTWWLGRADAAALAARAVLPAPPASFRMAILAEPASPAVREPLAGWLGARLREAA
jgi:hypothetical protein